jgi:hypothetical protein
MHSRVFLQKFYKENVLFPYMVFLKKIVSTPSFGGEVKLSVPCRALRHVKEPQSNVEVATFGKISRPFLAHSSTFRCWVRQRRFRRWGSLVAKVVTL